VPDATVGLLIQQEYQGHEAATQAVADVQKLDDHVTNIQSSADRTTSSLGDLKTGFSELPEPVRNTADAVQNADTAVTQFGMSAGAAVLAVVALNQAFDMAVRGAAEIVNVISGHEVAGFAQEMKNAAETTGLTTGELAGLKVGAADTGRSFDTLQAGLFRFSRLIGEAVADPLGNAAKKFDALGVSLYDANNQLLPTGDILKETGDRMTAMGSATEKSQTAFELFGRSGAAFIPVLALGLQDLENSAKKSGEALSPKAEGAALAAQIAFTKLSSAIEGLKNSVGAVGAGMFSPLVEGLTAVISKLHETWDLMGLIKMDMDSPAGWSMNIEALQAANPLPFAPLSKAGMPGDESIMPPMLSAEALATLKKEEADRATILQQINDQIAGLDRLHAVGRLGLDEEEKKLEAMKDQAIMLSDQETRKQEILAIDRQIADVAAHQIVTAPQLSRTPTQPGELLTPDFMKQMGLTAGGLMGQDLMAPKSFEAFGKQAEENLNATVKEVEARVKELSTSFQLTGKDSSALAELLKTHQSQIFDAYAKSIEEGDAYVTSLEHRAPVEAAWMATENKIGDAMRTMITGMVDAVISGTGSILAAFGNLVEQMVKTVAEATITNVVVGALGLAGGGTVAMADGGTYVAAQHGLLLSGTSGRDTLPVMAQRGEMFVSREDTDFNRTTMHELSGAMRSGAFNQKSGGDLHVHLHNEGGGTMDRAAVRQFITETYEPVRRDLAARGAIRGGR